jgi:hypothetical protein
MIKDAIANIAKWPAPETFQAVSLAAEIPSRFIHRILKLLFASDVPLRGLHRSVTEEKLNLFQFASTTMAQARASAAKIVGCQIAYAGLPGAPLHRVPDYVGCHASFFVAFPPSKPA